MILVNFRIVMPLAEAGIGLPRLRQNVLRFASFDVINDGSALEWRQDFCRHHGLVPAMPLDAGIIEMRIETQTKGILTPR